MFNKLAKDITGSADVCKCIEPQQFGSEPVLSYLIPGEIPYILLKSGKEEHIFTDQAYILSQGESSVSARRLVQRFHYSSNLITNVRFETAGMSMSDRDVELKFEINGNGTSIDIWKNEIEKAKFYYKAIVGLSKAQAQNSRIMELARYTVGAYRVPQENQNPLVAIEFAEALYSRYNPSSYQSVFEKYLLNNPK
ncbi:hypothetical protein BC833DRAFT_593774 [Globomyces pollinis-pini]|nr:hypothetical protein BC833DRAFT_593774 [Globomyces pollinis-pini]